MSADFCRMIIALVSSPNEVVRLGQFADSAIDSLLRGDIDRSIFSAFVALPDAMNLAEACEKTYNISVVPDINRRLRA